VQDDHIARHDFANAGAVFYPVAKDPGARRQPSMKRLDKLARAILLPEAEYAVDEDDSDNGPADLREPGGESETCGRP
jgi:hypothetical protein